MSDTPQTTMITRQQPQPRGQMIVATFPADKVGAVPVQSLVKTTNAGLIRSMLTHVPLSIDKGEMWDMVQFKPPADGGGEWQKIVKRTITAAGYDRLNQFAGLSFITPPTVKGDDNTDRPNPYLHREADEIRYVRVRMIGVGRNPTGNLVALDYTLSYDLGSYLAQDIMSKWTGKKRDQPKDWGKLLPAGLKPTFEKGTWHSWPVPGGLRLWVNLEVKEVVTIINEHIRRQLFAERNAITICRRNILKKHLAAATVNPDGRVPVVGWAEADRNFERIAEQVGSAQAGEINIDGEVINVQTDDEKVSDKDEIDGALGGEIDEDGTVRPEVDEDPPAPGVGVPTEAAATAAASNDHELAELRASIRATAGKLDPDALAGVMVEFQFSSLGEVANCADLERLRALNKALEEARLQAVQQAMKQTGQKMAAQAKDDQPPLIPDASTKSHKAFKR